MDNIEKLKEIDASIKDERQDDKNENEIELIDVLLAAAEFLDDPQNKEKEDAFNDIKQRTIVRSFLPLRRKSAVLKLILKDIQSADTAVYDFATVVELALTFDGLLAYTNINKNINTILKDYEFYDILIASGYCDMILEYCKRDYDRIKDMTDRLVSYQNIGDLLLALSDLNHESIDNLTKAIERLKLEIDPKMVHDVAEIVAGQDKSVHEINDIMQDTAVAMASKIISEEE